AKDGEHTVRTFDCRAARTGLALVAGRGNVAEVDAARSLQEVACRRGDIAQLGRGARQDGLRQSRIALLHQRMVRKIAVSDKSAYAHAAIRLLLDAIEAQAIDINQALRLLHAKLH